MVDDLSGRVVAITGAARGIGLALSRELTRRGARVAMGDVDVDELMSASPGLDVALRHELDVTDASSFARFLQDTAEELGPLDVLVNNAGIMPTGPVVEQDDEVDRRVLEVNLGGVFRGTRLALADMLPRRHGHIVNMASMLGELASPGVASYCGTKFAVVGFTDAVRREVRGTGVHLTTVLPSFVDSRMTQGLPSVRGFRNLTPEEVAVSVAAAIERRRSKVYVPRSAGVVLQLQRLLPSRGVDALMRPFGLDRMFTGPRRGATGTVDGPDR